MVRCCPRMMISERMTTTAKHDITGIYTEVSMKLNLYSPVSIIYTTYK